VPEPPVAVAVTPVPAPRGGTWTDQAPPALVALARKALPSGSEQPGFAKTSTRRLPGAAVPETVVAVPAVVTEVTLGGRAWPLPSPLSSIPRWWLSKIAFSRIAGVRPRSRRTSGRLPAPLPSSRHIALRRRSQGAAQLPHRALGCSFAPASLNPVPSGKGGVATSVISTGRLRLGVLLGFLLPPLEDDRSRQ
jgi:hypothetical protein